MNLTDHQQTVYSLDAALFAKEFLAFEPDQAQTAVLRSTAKRMLLNCTRQWGKSTITAIKAVHRAIFVPGSLVLVVSRAERQSGEFIRKARHFAATLGIRVRGDGTNSLSILFPQGSRIIGLPGVEQTLRGYSAVSLLIIDEAAVVPQEVYQMLRPMLAVSEGDLWIISTPRGKTGFYWELWDKGGPRWTRISVAATECPRISSEFLAEEREVLGDLQFRREYLCEFVQPEDSLFREEDIEACLTDDEPLPRAA